MFEKLFYTLLLFMNLTCAAQATIVEFKTSQGVIQVNLFDKSTPKTVANFLQYIDEQHYTNSLVHRVSTGFVVQGGGFTFEGAWPLTRLETNNPVINEPIYSNVKGTIAMAKLSGSANSATDQWFFNLANNASQLDIQNSGFTVFGQVIGDGMTVIEKIAQLKLCSVDYFQGIPMAVNEGQQCADLASPGIENFVVIENITIIDSSEATADDLNPIKNTLLSTSGEPKSPINNGSGGGSFTWFYLLCLLSFTVKNVLVKSKKAAKKAAF